MKVAIVVLAAGSSSRMGSVKQLLPVRGRPLLRIIMDEVLQTEAFPVVLVFGPHKNVLYPLVEGMPITIIENAQNTGMASSMIQGLVGAYMTSKEIEAVLFIASDSPNLKSKHLKAIIDAAISQKDKQIVSAKYFDAFGIPVLFKKPFFEKILDLKEDTGAKSIIKAHLEDTCFVDLPELALDLDSPEDYQKFLGES